MVIQEKNNLGQLIVVNCTTHSSVNGGNIPSENYKSVGVKPQVVLHI